MLLRNSAKWIVFNELMKLFYGQKETVDNKVITLRYVLQKKNFTMNIMYS